MEVNLYYPSNGTEGMEFHGKFCDRCYKRINCTILTKTMFGNEVKQWIYDEKGHPVCTSFNPNRPKRNKKYKNQQKLFE